MHILLTVMLLKVAIITDRKGYPVNYIKWIKKAGLEPVIIKRFGDMKKLKDADGIIFSGGGDIKHWFYSHKKIGNGKDVYRDLIEYHIFKSYPFLPILGICRGAQILNVFCKGTLKDLTNAYMHIGEGDVFHPIRSSKFTRLVSSRHHQAIDILADGFTAIAHCGEVIELARRNNIILCQYHPERCNDFYILRLFKDIIKKYGHKINRGVKNGIDDIEKRKR